MGKEGQQKPRQEMSETTTGINGKMSLVASLIVTTRVLAIPPLIYALYSREK